MDWNDWLRLLRWRALEEGDADGAILSEERRRQATARTRGGLTSESISPDPLREREATFLLKRAHWLDKEMIGWSGSLVRVLERLTVPEGRTSWAVAGWAAALVAGYFLSGLGHGQEFNLLALPLAGLLLWNTLVMAAALLWELWPTSSTARGSHTLEWLARRVSPAPDKVVDGDPQTGLTVDQRFALLAHAPAMERLQRRLRAWLHLAAAFLALGTIAGIYARGLATEYRAYWESTLLTAEGAGRFFSFLFTPASQVLGLELPLDQVPAMQRTLGNQGATALARPWIHLYAGTLFLLIIVPRLALAGLTLARARQVLAKRLRSLGWRSYLVRALRAVEGGHETLDVVVHAMQPTPAHQEVWARGMRERFGGDVQPGFIHVTLGDEDEFAENWRPAGGHAAVVFNLATTPELEVHRRFAQEMREALHRAHKDGTLVVLLDATSIGNRWSPDKQAGREKLWQEMLAGVADEVLIAARRGG